ncbi:MAG: phosphodiester glycosidase family protein [Acidimicrobiales bacterium]
MTGSATGHRHPQRGRLPRRRHPDRPRHVRRRHDGGLRRPRPAPTNSCCHAWNTWSFGPAIVDDGAVLDGIEDVEVDTNFGNHSIQGVQPRTGIGVIDDNHFVFVVVDGRSTGYSRGVTMTEFADIFVELGATTAYNLDGGGSSTRLLLTASWSTTRSARTG